MSEPETNETNAEAFEMMEVRYSLEEMLKEVARERKESKMSREIVDQSEIQTLFKNKKRKRKS